MSESLKETLDEKERKSKAGNLPLTIYPPLHTHIAKMNLKKKVSRYIEDFWRVLYLKNF
jgi:hypothetical protein